MKRIFVARLVALALAVPIGNALAQAPSNLNAQCGAGGVAATLSWAAVPGAVAYAPRLNNLTNDNPSCAYGWMCGTGGDWIDNNYTNTIRVASVVPGQPYMFWVHGLVNGNWAAPSSINFTCPLLTLSSQGTVNNLNSQIMSGNVILDYLIQNVCVDASDRPIVGDPATCGTSRNVRIGERVPYILTDVDTRNNNTRYEGHFSYPLAGTDGLLKVIAVKQLIGGNRPVLDANYQYGFSETRDGYDLLDVSDTFVSAIRTSDGGCFDQKFSTPDPVTGNFLKRTNGWRFMPRAGATAFGTEQHNIRIDRLTPIIPSTCNRVDRVLDNSVLAVWSPPEAITFESGKTLSTIQTSHVANFNFDEENNAIEKYFFTREYGYTRWEAWEPQAKCIAKRGNNPICFPDTQANILSGRCPTRVPDANGNPTIAPTPLPGIVTLATKPWVRVDCRDATSYVALNTPSLPLDGFVGQSNGLVDIDSASVFNAYELILRGNQDFSHLIGSPSGNTWVANVSTSGFLSYGPYTTALPGKPLTADFRFVSDFNAAPNVPAVNFDVYDATAGVLLGSSLIYRQSLAAPNQEGSFKVNFDMTGRAGHAIEFRSYSYGASNVRLNKVVIQPTP
jgi:hypothetical protein